MAHGSEPCKGTPLRPYQGDAIERVRAWLKTCRKVLLVAPTGAGKTVIAAYIIARAYVLGRRVIFFAHRRELIHQTRRKLIAAGIPAADIGVLMADDRFTNPAAPIQIASIDTWRHREPPPADLVIVDEAHRSLAQTYLEAVEYYTESGAFVLGMTATPYRADGGGLGHVYEALEVVATPGELIAEGFLVEPRVFSAPADARPDLSGVRVRRGDYLESDLADAMNTGQLVGGIVEHWRKHAEGRRTVVFAVNVAHSKAICEAFIHAGIPAEHLDGKTPTTTRDAILARLEAGETLIVCNCGVLCEGWDQPAVKCAILARPTKSTGLYLQQAGRILRPWEGVGALILDHAGNALVHGLPQDDRTFDLHETRKREGEAPTKECPSCNAVIAANAQACPECGHVFPPRAKAPKESAGELVEIKPADAAEMRTYWESLCEIQHARGYKPGWIAYRFREKYNRKPPPGCRLPIEQASPEEKAEALRELREQRIAKGYKPGWVVHRFSERFGHPPGATP